VSTTRQVAVVMQEWEETMRSRGASHLTQETLPVRLNRLDRLLGKFDQTVLLIRAPTAMPYPLPPLVLGVNSIGVSCLDQITVIAICTTIQAVYATTHTAAAHAAVNAAVDAAIQCARETLSLFTERTCVPSSHCSVLMYVCEFEGLSAVEPTIHFQPLPPPKNLPKLMR